MKGVHPLLVACVCLALRRLSLVDFGVGKNAVRTIEDQKRMVENGVSKTLKSKHLIQSDGYSHAVDLYPSGYKNIDDIPDNAFQSVKCAMVDAADALGIELQCGYDWGWDKPHYQIKRIIKA